MEGKVIEGLAYHWACTQERETSIILAYAAKLLRVMINILVNKAVYKLDKNHCPVAGIGEGGIDRRMGGRT